MDRARIGFENLYPDLTQFAPTRSNPAGPSDRINKISTNGFYWTQWSAGRASPPGAVRGGTDVDGTAIYVGRAYHNGELVPAKAMPDKNEAYISSAGGEIAMYSCELLCRKQLSWVPSAAGRIPTGALPIGNTKDGEILYAGRVFHEGSRCVGKVHPSHGVCYVPFGGREHAHSNYETLVLI